MKFWKKKVDQFEFLGFFSWWTYLFTPKCTYVDTHLLKNVFLLSVWLTTENFIWIFQSRSHVSTTVPLHQSDSNEILGEKETTFRCFLSFWTTPGRSILKTVVVRPLNPPPTCSHAKRRAKHAWYCRRTKEELIDRVLQCIWIHWC